MVKVSIIFKGDYMNKFSEKLIKLRKDKAITRKELAEILGITSTAVGLYERGERLPKKEIMDKIVDYFGVPRDELLSDNYELRRGHSRGDRGDGFAISEDKTEYLVEEAFDAAKFIYDNPEYVELFKLMKDVKKENISFVKTMLEKLI